MQPISFDSTPCSPELDSKALFEDAELVNTNTGKFTTSKPSDPYIYYRIYTEDGAIPSKSPVYTDDPYLARIWTKQVALPRTLTSLKQCLSSIECLGSAHDEITLFASANSEGLMEDMSCSTGVVSLTHDTGTPGYPIILFVKEIRGEHERLVVSKPEAVLLPSREGVTPFIAEFLYYRIYTEYGAIPSKHPINSSDLSLGRINIDIITPPHTIDSIKRCIAKAEQLRRPVNWVDTKLFRNMGSATPMDTAKVSVLGGGDRLGLSEDDPMVYVHSNGAEYRVIQTASWCSDGYEGWLDITSGEILYMVQEEATCHVQEATCHRYGGTYYDAYKLINKAGASGYVNTSYVVRF